MPNIISRSGWGARAPRSGVSAVWRSRTGFTVHYSSGPPTQTPRQIQDFHMDGRGWSDVGYNFLVDHRGRVYEGRGWTTVGAHAAPHNVSHIGVCFIGGDGDATDAAKVAIRSLYDEANRRAGRTLAKTYHGGLSGNSTSCPGSDLRSWVRAGMPSSGGAPSRPAPPPGTGRLAEDGRLGPLTLRAAQAELGVAVDGVWGPVTVRAMQRRVGAAADGFLGPKTTRAVQRRVGATVDGMWPSIRGYDRSGTVTADASVVSETTRRLQAALNEEKF
nr:peptidoglycan-binding domain-containing protein [Nocardiopsis sp. Huas11]